jgi:aspartate/methionine/tyrosine aminotransferase
VISNAHNPSGALTPPEVLGRIGEIAASAGAIVVVDEVYAEAQHTDSPPPAPAATLGEVFVSTNSLTKAYGLAGVRCGWVLASPSISERIRIARDVVDGSGPFVTEALAVRAFEKIAVLRSRARAILAKNFAALWSMGASHPRLEWIAPEAGTTAFPRVRDLRDTASFVDYLIEKHDTVVVPGHFFQKPDHIRISFGGEPGKLAASLEKLDAALRAYPS